MPRPAGLSAEQRQAREENLQEAERVARALRCVVQRPFNRPRSKVPLASVARDFGVSSATLSQRTRVGIVSDEEAEGNRGGSSGWFARIRATQKQRQIRGPSQIWHAASQGFLVDFSDSESDGKGKLAHLIETVSAATDVLRPSIFFEDSRPVGSFRNPDDWFRGAIVQNVDQSGMSVAMERWLVNFEQQTRPYIEDGQWRQLILDDIETCSQAFYDLAEEHRIFVTFPSSATTHLVLPLDGGMLNDLQSSYFFIAKTDPAFRRGEPLDKVTFLRHLKCAHEEVFENPKSSDAIREGWKLQGLWPLNGEDYHEAFELPGAIRARGSKQRRRGESWEIVRRHVWVEEEPASPSASPSPSPPPAADDIPPTPQPHLVSTSNHLSATSHRSTPAARYTPYSAPQPPVAAQASSSAYSPYRPPLQPVQGGSNASSKCERHRRAPPLQPKANYAAHHHLPQPLPSTSSRAPNGENAPLPVWAPGGMFVPRNLDVKTLWSYQPHP